jgi:hypothetical protein
MTTGHLTPALVRVKLIIEAQFRRGLGSLGVTDLDPTDDKVDHPLAFLKATTDPIYPPSLESYSEYGREVNMVEQGGELLEKTVEDIQ